MPLVIREIHAAPSSGALNQEWFVLENTGEKSFSTAGCTVSTGRAPGQGSAKTTRLKTAGTLDPGFQIGSGEKVRVVTGVPGRKAHGAPPAEDGVRNYFLLQSVSLLAGPGSIVALSLKQHELVRATYDPKAPGGVASTTNGASS
jgi:hypothetical protein